MVVNKKIELLFLIYIEQYNIIINMSEELTEIGWSVDRIGEPHAYLIDEIADLSEAHEIVARSRIRYDSTHSRLESELLAGTPNRFSSELDYNSFSSELDYIPFNNPHVISIKVDTFSITEDEKTCCICMETPHTDKICQTNCQHKFCVDCLTQYTKTKQTCPLCRTLITDISVSTEEICGQLRATI